MSVSKAETWTVSRKGKTGKNFCWTAEKKQNKKRKAVLENVEVFQKQKKQMETDIDHLKSSADKLFEKADVTGKMQFLSEATAIRRPANENKLLSKKLDDTVKKLKSV